MLLLPPVEVPVPPVLAAEDVVVDVDRVVGVVEVVGELVGTLVGEVFGAVVEVVVVPVPPPVPGRH